MGLAPWRLPTDGSPGGIAAVGSATELCLQTVVDGDFPSENMGKSG